MPDKRNRLWTTLGQREGRSGGKKNRARAAERNGGCVPPKKKSPVLGKGRQTLKKPAKSSGADGVPAGRAPSLFGKEKRSGAADN